MSATEMYDKLSTIASDVDQTLSISIQGTLSETGNFKQEIKQGDDGSEERISLASSSIFFVSFSFMSLSLSDMGTIFDLYFDPAKANGMVNSFKWSSRQDGHTYVVRFDCEFIRTQLGIRMGSPEIRLRVLGRIADA